MAVASDDASTYTRNCNHFRPDTVFFPSSKKWPCTELIFRRQQESFWYFRERLACLTMRNRVLSPRTKFEVVWAKSSQQPVCFGMDRRFHMDNHEKCYLLDGLKQKPQLLYQHPHVSREHKITTIMQYFIHLRHPQPTKEEESTVSLALTEDGHLKAFNADSGELLRNIFLSSTIKYRYLLWAEYLYSVQVKSVQYPQQPGGQVFRRQAGAAGVTAATELVRFVIFDIHPLRLSASFKIDQQVFGIHVTDAYIDGNILIIVHRGRFFWFYSLKALISMNTTYLPTLGERLEDKTVGDSPMGIPLTMDIKELPPLLLRVVSSPENAVSFGGCPFHYLHNPDPKSVSRYCLRSVSGNHLLHSFSSDDITVNPDVVEFHFDDHQRLLHIASGRVSCFLFDPASSTSPVKLMYTVNFQESSQHTRSHDHHVTRSGRVVKRVKSYENSLDSQCIIHELDFENELDLVYAVVSQPSPGEEGCYDTFIIFIDDWSGEVLKKVPVPTWTEVDEGNSVHLELTSIIHQRQIPSSKYTCYIYALKTINI